MKLNFCLALSLCSLASLAHAQSETYSTRARLGEEAVTAPPEGFVPYLGFNAGYTRADTSADRPEGVPASVKLIGSYYPTSLNAVFDAGLGVSNQQFTKDTADRGAITGANLELAARYPFENRWQAGVVYDTLFNQGAAYEAEQADAQFAGLQVLKEFDIGSSGWLGRVGGRLMTDLNVPGHTVNMAFIDFQLGWNPSSSRPTTTHSIAALPIRTVHRPVAPAARRPASKDPLWPSLMADIGDRPGFAHFPLNVDRVQPRDEKRVRALAKAVERRPDLFERMDIIGHADPTGPESLNQKLSERRAQNVRNLLVASGWPKARITAFGEGESDPLVLSKRAPNFGDNRRVEIEFKGVRNPKELRRLITSLK